MHHILVKLILLNYRGKDAGFKIRDKDLKKSSLRDAKSAESETSRIITNVSKISRSGQNFPRPTFFEEPFYTPTYVFRAINELLFASLVVNIINLSLSATK